MKRGIVWVALLALLWANGAQAADLRWTWQNPTQGNDLLSVTYGAGLFVAVGDRGVIMTSPDAQVWTVQSSPTREPLRSITYADGRFVAVGGRLPQSTPTSAPADDVVITSTDGLTWRTAETGDGPALSGITYGQGKFVAVGGCAWPAPEAGRSVLTSTDGLTWESAADPAADGFCGVAFGNGRFVAVSARSRSAVFTSTDGGDWSLTAAAGDDEFDGFTWRGVAFAQGQFVVVANYGHVRTSTDGEHWSLGQLISSGPHEAQMTVAGDRLFALGEAVSSPDGVTWSPMKVYGRSVAYGAGLYVIVGDGGYTATSTDADNWQALTPEKLPNLNTIIYADGKYVAAGDARLSLTSTDGIAWSVGHWQHDLQHSWSGTDFIDIDYGNGRFVGVDANGGKLAVSTDGLNWQETWRSDLAAIPGVLLFADGHFLAGTPKGLLTSADGENWQVVYPGDQLWFKGLIWDGARYVAVTSAPYGPTSRPVLLTSVDGALWESQTLSVDPIQAMAYGNGKFVAMAVHPPEQPAEPNTLYLVTSTDAVHWTAVPNSDSWAAGPGAFRSIRYTNGLFLAPTYAGDLYTSVDGESWRLQPTGAPVIGAVFLNGRLMTTGRDGAILFSEPVCGTFLDLPAGDAACPAVTALLAHKVVGGFPDGSFQPEAQVKRAELAKMLTLTLDKSPLPGDSLPFSDTAGHWAATAGYLQSALTAGAMSGYPDHTFRPNGAITRAELVKTILAAAGIPPATKATADYADVSPTAWYAPWVAAAEQAGLIGPGSQGALWPDPTLAPEQPATRAEAARLLQSLLR